MSVDKLRKLLKIKEAAQKEVGVEPMQSDFAEQQAEYEEEMKALWNQGSQHNEEVEIYLRRLTNGR